MKRALVALVVTIAVIAAATPKAQEYFRSVVAVVVANIVTTSTDGVVLSNPTASTVGVPVQMSPRYRWQGTAWDTDDSVSRDVSFFAELLPESGATALGTWRLGIVLPTLGTVYPITQTSADLITLTDVQVPTGSAFEFGTTRSKIKSIADGNFQFMSSAGNFGAQFFPGTAAPTVNTCGTGTITADSRNTSGDVTATGATACTIAFNGAWTVAPHCVVTLRTSPTTTPFISAISTTAFTVSNLTAGNRFNYHCMGSI